MDREVEEQANRYVTQRTLELSKAREAARQAVQNDVVKRGVARSGIHVGQLIHEWSGLIEKHCDDLLSDLLSLVERHVGLGPDSADWLRQKLDRHVDGLARGVAQSLAEVTARVGVPGLKEANASEMERLAGRLKSRARLRIDTALGEATLSQRRERTEPPAADLDEMVPPLLKKQAFQRDLEASAAEALDEGYPLSLIMLDGDGFKGINDEHGHDVGDEVIKDLGRLIWRAVMKRGSGYRFGGDEFALLLPNHSADEAVALAERLRGRIEAATVSGRGLKLTATLGVACLPDDASEANELFRAADQALLDGKNRGRNRVQRAAETGPSKATPEKAWDGVMLEGEDGPRYFDWGRRMLAVELEDAPLRMTQEFGEEVCELLWERDDVSPQFRTPTTEPRHWVYETDRNRKWKRKLRADFDEQYLVATERREPPPPKCPECGKRSSLGANFCSRCMKAGKTVALK